MGMGDFEFNYNNNNQIDNDNNNIDQQKHQVDEKFQNYDWEKKVHKSSFKKKLSQAKRLLTNKASTEYSQMEEQNEPKSIPQMLVSVSKINDLRAKVNTKTKKYDK